MYVGSLSSMYISIRLRINNPARMNGIINNLVRGGQGHPGEVIQEVGIL